MTDGLEPELFKRTPNLHHTVMKSRLVYRSPTGGPRRFAQWLLDLRGRSGAYVIRRTRTKETLYVGESHTGRLPDTIRRHFWFWSDDGERKHYTYDPDTVEVAFRLTSPGNAVAAQNELIERLDPKDNTYGFDDPDEPF